MLEDAQGDLGKEVMDAVQSPEFAEFANSCKE